eukprot:gene10906-12711_t
MPPPNVTAAACAEKTKVMEIIRQKQSRGEPTFIEEDQIRCLNYAIEMDFSDTTREQVIVPSNTWGGSGLAGISIRYCSWEKTLENVWHILDVYMNSPAHEATIQTRTDYIVGTPDMILNEQEDFFTLINNNMYRPIQLYVYSSLTEQVRIVTITPNKNWGGSGSLGCDIGYGLLHRIPTKQNITSQMLTPSIDQIKSFTSTPTAFVEQNGAQTDKKDSYLTPNKPEDNNVPSADIEDLDPIKFDLTKEIAQIELNDQTQQQQQQINQIPTTTPQFTPVPLE